MVNHKHIDLELIPEIQERIIALISQEVDNLAQKEELTTEDQKNLIAFSAALTTIYKDYRAEVLAILKDIKPKSKQEMSDIIRSEVKK